MKTQVQKTDSQNLEYQSQKVNLYREKKFDIYTLVEGVEGFIRMMRLKLKKLNPP